MEYFAGLDVSMEETHVCVVDRDGVVTHQAKVASTPTDIAQELAKAPACRRVVFETGRMAPMLFHGPTSFLRAMINDLTACAGSDFTCTGLKKPVRAR